MLRPEIAELTSKTNLTEADLQAVLNERDLYLSQGDELGYAHCLTVLAFVVLWVRSDNNQPPFERAYSLAMEALPIMRSYNDSAGTIDALLGAVPLSAPAEATRMLDAALEIAKEMGDDRQIARVLGRQAAKLGMSDRKQAFKLNSQVLEIYEKLGSVSGQARTLFSMAIQCEGDEAKFDYSVRSANLFRSIGRLDQSARAISLALMYGTEHVQSSTLLELAEQGLRDAQTVGKTLLEGCFYKHFAQIHGGLGNFEEAEKYQGWAQQIDESDGLSPKERKQQELLFTQEMIEICKKQGNAEAEKMFKEKLRELKKTKIQKKLLPGKAKP